MAKSKKKHKVYHKPKGAVNTQKKLINSKEAGKSEGFELGFISALYMALPAYYNTKPDDIISDEEFGKWVAKAEVEASRIFREEFRGDFDVAVKAILTPELEKKENIDDNVDFGIEQIQRLRKHLNLELL